MEASWVSLIDRGERAALIEAIQDNPHLRTSLRAYATYQTDMATPLGYAIISDNEPMVRALLRYDCVNHCCWCDIKADLDDHCGDLDALGLAVKKHVRLHLLDTLLTYGAPSPDSLRFALYCTLEELAEDPGDPYLKHVRRALEHALRETLEYLDRFYAVRWCCWEICKMNTFKKCDVVFWQSVARTPNV